MGLFDNNKKSSNISFPQKGEDMKPAFPEPPESIDDLGSVKNSVESSIPTNDLSIDDNAVENALEEVMVSNKPTMPTNFGQRPKMESNNPILYIKLSEYKEVVQATNNMRKDIEKAKTIVGDLRMIERDENSKLEKSEEVIKEVEDIISLFEKVMITPIE
jgi:hypothetical protein